MLAHRGTEGPSSGCHRTVEGKPNTPNAYMYAWLLTFYRILIGKGRRQPDFDSQSEVADRDPPRDG